MQSIVDIKIIYHCQEHLPEELKRQLKSSVGEHLSQSNTSIDEWHFMLKFIMHQEVIKKNKKVWQEAGKKF
jgi:hypothetical protein